MSRTLVAVVLALLVSAILPAQRQGGGGGGGGGKGRNADPESPPAAGAPAKGGSGKEQGDAKPAAPVVPADPAVVAMALTEFQQAWAKAEAPQKVVEVQKLAALGGEEIAVALAAKLNDRSPEVRRALAEALGRLKQAKVVPQLGAALTRELEPETAEITTLQAMCAALGIIGDPKAIPFLTRNVFAGNEQAEGWSTKVQARLAALGSIRHKESIDALVELFGKLPSTGNSRRSGGGGARGGGGGGGNSRMERLVETPLRKLTGENHENADAWRDWWKGARASFQFD